MKSLTYTSPVNGETIEYTIRITSPERRDGRRLAIVSWRSSELFSLVVKCHSCEQVAARLVALGYPDGPATIIYGDSVGMIPSVYRLTGRQRYDGAARYEHPQK